MKWSQTLIPTSRQVPAEAVVPSHQLMLRAGLIRSIGAGLYDYLPLGLRVLQRVMNIVREEMNAAGASELLMPALIPMEFYADTKRDIDYGDNLFKLTDRHGRSSALGPTHEEVITELMKAYVTSYRQLPLNLYQIQTKYRDEFRPRFGVLRCREFLMKDAYSFHVEVEGPGGLNETYDRMYAAYCRIFDRCGLNYSIVEAESGPIGGSASHEFMCNSPVGEDTILKSDKGNYAANVEKCAIGERPHDLNGAPTGELEEVLTPDCKTIAEVCSGWKQFAGGKLRPENMLKTLVFLVEGAMKQPLWEADMRPKYERLKAMANEAGADVPTFIQTNESPQAISYRETLMSVPVVFTVVRGDHEVNEGKLNSQVKRFLGDHVRVVLPTDWMVDVLGIPVGYVGPHAALNFKTSLIIVDQDAARGGFWVTGANKQNFHVRHFNWAREIGTPLFYRAREGHFHVADIRNAVEGDPSPLNDGGVLRASKGIEVGHVFKLGTKYSDAMGFAVLDEKQQKRSVIMGCYGIGIGRIIASAIEMNHDENGIVWPASIAPFDVLITPIKYEGEAKDVTDRLEAQLTAAGLDVLVDDRDERPGPKFKDADLIGIPIRLTIGDKALAQGCVEMVKRDGSLGKGEMVKIEEVITRCSTAIDLTD